MPTKKTTTAKTTKDDAKPEAKPAPEGNGASDAIDFDRLADFFNVDEIEWKVQKVFQPAKKGQPYRALCVCYVTNRAIQDRLDEVFGPARWKNHFTGGPDGGVLCGISAYLKMPDGTYQWITKWDGAENTHYEPVKGGLSTSMKRAAIEWKIGRYLYRVPAMIVPAQDDKGKKLLKEPEMPPAFLPPDDKGKRQIADEDRIRAERAFHAAGVKYYGDQETWDKERPTIIKKFARRNRFEATSTNELTIEMLDHLSGRMRSAVQEITDQRNNAPEEDEDQSKQKKTKRSKKQEPEPEPEDEDVPEEFGGYFDPTGDLSSV